MFLVALRIGWLSWLVADGGAVRRTLEGLSWVAALLAVSFSALDLRKQRTKPVAESGVHIGRALYLDGDRLPKVADVSLLALRVKRAVDTFDDEGRDLPPYVPRDRDEDLDWAIASGGLVLLHGRAAAGKSRAAAEAVRRLRPAHDLLVPVDGPALRQIAESSPELTDTVVWLDDLERFLVPGGLDLGLLQRLAPSVCVVATIRDHELAAHRAADGAINKAAADLIAGIPPSHLIVIDKHLTEAERERAKTAQAGDPRISQALIASEGFAEYLAAGTPMLQRWSIGDSPLFYVGQAVISAAIDCRRAGYSEAVPGAALAELYRGYLPSPWRDRSDLPPVAEGLDWAARPVLGASSCLQPRTGGAYLASDYLVDRAQEGTCPLGDSPIPDRTWEVLLSVSSGQNIVSVGLAAYDGGRFETAERFFRRAVDSGDETALGPLSMTIGRMNRFSEVNDILLNAAQSGNEDVMAYALMALAIGDRFGDISDLARQAITDDDSDVIYLATAALSERGRSGDLHDLFAVAIDHGRPDMIYAISASARKLLSAEQLVSLVRCSIETGNAPAVAATIFSLKDTRGEYAEGIFGPGFDWLAGQDKIADYLMFPLEAIENENLDSLHRFAARLVNRNQDEVIVRLRRHAVKHGRTKSADLLRSFEPGG
ncbi:hypothetical protein AB0J40_24605 [Amycolatopsis sp. NPDC049691]|uniref:hypothetical protein n=1 Tax=Amycolatopsis sp. NPDC049691 TaxID=3155155 RepID=UPI0034313FB5